MKKNYLTLAIAYSMLLYSPAFAHTNYIGYSGAPGSNGTCASSCHGSPGGTIQINGFPSEYVPGETYIVSISHSSGSSIRQFNGSCRIGGGSQNAGIIASGTNTATYNTANETNGIRFSSSNQDNGTFNWTAPSEGTGEVRLYIAGLQGGSSGLNSALEISAVERPVDIDDEYSPDMPLDYSLQGNYPNPFNSSTTIQYNLPVVSDVSIEIYDILGRKVETLINGRQQAGYLRVTWNAKNQSSGMYFYRIQAGDYIETKKMVLLR